MSLLKETHVKKQQVVIVDPYYTHLNHQFLSQNVAVIAVFSDFQYNATIDKAYPLDKSIFADVMYARNDNELQQCIRALKDCGVKEVINGHDTGARLWVKICVALGLPFKPPLELAEVLRNKFDTTEYLNRKGVPVAQHTLIKLESLLSTKTILIFKLIFP